MVRFARLAVLFFAITMFAGLVVVLQNVQGRQVTQRNQQRQKDVSFIAEKIEQYAKENASIPGFNKDLQQLGTSESDCQITTPLCKDTAKSCINVNMLMKDRELSLPSDISIGSYYKTGYAVKFDTGSEVVTVIACGAEQGADISVSRSLHEALQQDRKHAKK